MASLQATDSVHVVNVFTVDRRGGNPATIVLDADRLSPPEMQRIAQQAGHECGFVCQPPVGSTFDAVFRFFVPRHEMEMCGHATIGALWLLHRLGRLPHGRDRVEISTRSGAVTGRIEARGTHDARIAISQPSGEISPLPDPIAHARDIVAVLGIAAADLAPHPIVNARTSRVKTLVALNSADAVHALRPDFTRMEAVCAAIGSTGLYPFAPVDLEHRIFEARQFPRASGYPEDPATGIAASALAFGLLAHGLVTANDAAIAIYQGRAMGQLSRIDVAFQRANDAAAGCWITGETRSTPDQHGARP